jgi:hypothetical protein
MESHDDTEIIYMTKIIEDQKTHLINFKPDISLEGLHLEFGVRSSSYDKLTNFLETSGAFKAENLQKEADGESLSRLE